MGDIAFETNVGQSFGDSAYIDNQRRRKKLMRSFVFIRCVRVCRPSGAFNKNANVAKIM